MQHKISRTLKTLIAVCLSVGLMSASSVGANKPGIEDPVKKNKNTKSKTFVSRNNNSVRIYPDVLKREMHVVAKDHDGREIDFFVFDLNGTLVQHYKMKAKDHYRIGNLARGEYIYRVFCGDEETAAGKFQIR